MKCHNPVTGKVRKSSLSPLWDKLKKTKSIQIYATLGLLNRAPGVREAYSEYHVSFR